MTWSTHGLLSLAAVKQQRTDPLTWHATCRLSEPESTLQKRLAWAQQQVFSATAPGLFDVAVQTESPEASYEGLQRAVATLSPAVRHRLQGLPADVLDYADLIASSSVEQPIFKPVLIAGERLPPRQHCSKERLAASAAEDANALVSMPVLAVSVAQVASVAAVPLRE